MSCRGLLLEQRMEREGRLYEILILGSDGPAQRAWGRPLFRRPGGPRAVLLAALPSISAQSLLLAAGPMLRGIHHVCRRALPVTVFRIGRLFSAHRAS